MVTWVSSLLKIHEKKCIFISSVSVDDDIIKPFNFIFSTFKVTHTIVLVCECKSIRGMYSIEFNTGNTLVLNHASVNPLTCPYFKVSLVIFKWVEKVIVIVYPLSRKFKHDDGYFHSFFSNVNFIRQVVSFLDIRHKTTKQIIFSESCRQLRYI